MGFYDRFLLAINGNTIEKQKEYACPCKSG